MRQLHQYTKLHTQQDQGEDFYPAPLRHGPDAKFDKICRLDEAKRKAHKAGD